MTQRTTKSRELHRAGSATRDGLVSLNALIGAHLSMALQSAALAIAGAGLLVAKNVAAFYYTAIPSALPETDPVLGLVAANTNTAAFVGTVTNGKFNVYVHTVSDDGTGVQTFRTRMGTEGATRAAVKFPAIPAGEVVYGFTEIHPTGAGNFVGGTTALDSAGVIPNAAFVSVISDMAGPVAAVKKIGGETGKTLA